MFSTSSREREPDTYVPYVGHATPGSMLLDDGARLVTFGLAGLAAEMMDVDASNSAHEQLNITLRNTAGDGIVLATHLVRRLADGSDYPASACRTGFSGRLDAAYRAHLLSNRLYRNDLFVSVLFRVSQAGGKRVSGLLNPRRRGDTKRHASVRDLERLEQVASQLEASLHAYGPVRLRMRSNKHRVMMSQIGEAMRLVLTNEFEPVPVVQGHMGGAIYTDRVIVGREAIEIRGVAGSTFAAGFALREYPTRTWPGMFDALLSAPYSCCLTQTFGFLPKQVAHDRMNRKQNQMAAANDKAASQAAELTLAADRLQSNEFVMGDHHLTLLVYADSLPALGEVAALARRHLAESGAVVTREDLALEGAYWSQLPGNMHLRSRPGAITSRNFAAMSSFHNYPPGEGQGQWGEPVALLRTVGGTGFRHHFHVNESGNTFVTGPARSGKSTVLTFLLSQSERAGAQVVLFDKDRGSEIYARAVNGSCLVVTPERTPMLAPLRALTGSDHDVSFLHRLLSGCIIHGGGYEMTPDDDDRLDLGLRSLMQLPPEARAMRELRAFMGHADPQGAGARLERWCKGRELGWALDGDTDAINLDSQFIYFDVTGVLDDKDTRGAIMAYLFQRVNALADGRRLVIAIDEFWKALLDEAFRDMAHDALKTRGKQNVVVILATQSPHDALASPIAHTIIEQCATQIHMPNPKADRADYMAGLKLTEAEFMAVRQNLSGGRRFLLKQGEASVAIDLDLADLADFVAVLSGKRNTLRLMERLMREHGCNAQDWLPAFYAQWRDADEGETLVEMEKLT